MCRVVAVALELLGDGGQENLFDVGHDSAGSRLTVTRHVAGFVYLL